MRDSQGIAEFGCIRRTEVIVSNEFVKVEDESICSQKTIQNNCALILVDIRADVIKAVTCLEVMRSRATKNRELCGFQLSLHKDATPCVCICTS